MIFSQFIRMLDIIDDYLNMQEDISLQDSMVLRIEFSVWYVVYERVKF